MPHETPRLPPIDLAQHVRLVRLPLHQPAVDAIQRRLLRARPGGGRLELVHELGDVRFAQAFAPERRDAAAAARWGGGLAVFGLLEGASPAVLAYTLRPLGELGTVPLPNGWRDDPYDWSGAEDALLLPRLERRAGMVVPFASEVWPKVRIVDPAKAPTGKRRVPRMREVDAARLEQIRRPELPRPEAYGLWLQRQVPVAQIDPGAVRILGETTGPAGDGHSFTVLATRLNGLLRFDDPMAMAVTLLRGIGRRRAYGLGLLVLA